MVQRKSVAVILAAGYGKRMGGEKPKPLTPLFGIPIVEHTIRAFLERNYEIFIVYSDKRVENFIKRKYPQIKLVKNDAPEWENGYSLYVLKDYVDRDFLLAMADHYYGENFFNFCNKTHHTKVFVSKFCIDPAEATKVKVDNGKVVNIGKNLTEYDFFDTGMFYCRNEVFEYAERMVKSKRVVKLSDVFKKIAEDKKLGYEIVNEDWFDIDTSKDLNIAEEKIKKSLIKDEDGIISRKINRKISLEISKRLVKYDAITPNRLTLISFLLGLISSLFFFLSMPIVGGIMAQITSIFDGCDGEIARIKRIKTKFGGTLDAVTDRYADIFILLGLSYLCSLTTLSLIAFFLAVSGVIMVSYTWHLTKVRVRVGGRDMRLFIIMLGGIFGFFHPPIILLTILFIGILTHACSIYSLLFSRRSEGKIVI